LADVRAVVRASYPPTRYTPSYLSDWEVAYARFRQLLTSS